jgi:hypothetical protein
METKRFLRKLSDFFFKSSSLLFFYDFYTILYFNEFCRTHYFEFLNLVLIKNLKIHSSFFRIFISKIS